ncbi:MAG TPA: hypothetical protein DC050_09610, partial [Pseudomonas sp.]|nr:hypothetical protein [Pseudomonas sp.]
SADGSGQHAGLLDRGRRSGAGAADAQAAEQCAGHADSPAIRRLLRRARGHSDRQLRLLLHLRPVPPGRHRPADLLPLFPRTDAGQALCPVRPDECPARANEPAGDQ